MIYALLAVCCVALFALSYLMDKWHGVTFCFAMAALLASTQPTFAQDAPTDSNWPSMSEKSQPVLLAYNTFGNRIVLFANFCAGDAAHQDHMHTYGVYDSRNQFIQGGCWKFDPTGTRKTQTIEYFDMGAHGWDKWSLHAFKPVKALDNKCRGNSGDDPKTWQACKERDASQFN